MRILRLPRRLPRTRTTFRVTRPNELWRQSVTHLWTEQHGSVHLHSVVDCCTREVIAWTLSLHSRPVDAIVCLDAALRTRAAQPLALTLETAAAKPLGSHAFRERVRLGGLGHRRGEKKLPADGGWETTVATLPEACVGWQLLCQARASVQSAALGYHLCPQSGLGGRSPAQVARVWAPALGTRPTTAA